MTEFVKRTTKPTKDKYYYSDNIFQASGYGMWDSKGNERGNCTAYAWGRFYELTGKYPKLCTSNAENWYKYNDGYERSKTPKLGAVIVWSKGKIGNAKDGAGHVAVVEEIYPDGSILTSNSGWKSTFFYMKKIPSNYKLNGYKFEGFIYNPVEFEEKPKKITYQVYDNVKNKWLNNITAGEGTGIMAYAGNFGNAISGLKVDELKYRAHDKKKNKWLPWVIGRSDYAGNLPNDIDGVQIYNCKYRVHLKGGTWLSWISKVDNTSMGYAGIIGKSIDAIEIKVE